MDKANMTKIIKVGIIILIGMGIWFAPCPEGLSPMAWKYFSAYVVAIVGILLHPYPSPVIMLGVLGVYGMILGPKSLLGGFASTTTWQVFAAFMISVSFAATGLGKRIAYHLIGVFGKTSLGMGYSVAFTDLILGMAVPSTTARAGGVIFPIFNNVAKTLGSSVEDGTSRKLASYLCITSAQSTLITAAVFLTGMAPNVQVAAYADEILGVNLDWMMWAKMGIVPGLCLVLLIPFINYKLYPPEIKKVENYKELSQAGLKEIGSMTLKEKYLTVFFVGAVILWATTSITGFNATAVAILFLGCCLFFGCMSWTDVRQSKGAWDTFIWYGAIIGLSTQLSSEGFFTWFAELLQQKFDFNAFDSIIVLIVLVVGGLVVRYMFASASVYTTSMIPVMYTIGLVGGVPALPLAMMCATCSAYGGMLTNYSGASGPVLFGYGHVEMKKWWMLGAISTICCVLVYFLIGLPYWKLLGMW